MKYPVEKYNSVMQKFGLYDTYFSDTRKHWPSRRLDIRQTQSGGFPGGTVVKNPPAKAGDSSRGPRSHMLRSN